MKRVEAEELAEKRRIEREKWQAIVKVKDDIREARAAA